MTTKHTIESDCYDGNFKINSIDKTGISNLLTMNKSLVIFNKILVSNQDANFYKKVTIGTKKATYHTDALLHVEGKIAAQYFVITKPTNWSDKVFDKNYKLLSLSEIEQFIAKNKHLPEVPSEAEVMKKGYDTNEMDALLLQKIEELTLYTIEQNKKIEDLQKQIIKLQNQ